MDEDRKEMSELRRQHQELLNVEVRKFTAKLLISNSLKGDAAKIFFTLQFYIKKIDNFYIYREDQMSLWVSCMERY